MPKEKQQAIINAGYQVLSRNSYKKSPVSEIAEIAGISKSLLFYYFRNKKELYLFLWEKLSQATIEAIEEYECYEKKDLFEMLMNLDSLRFKEGIDLNMMFRDIYLASEGYLWEMFRREDIDVEKMERDFEKMIEFWKKFICGKTDI